MIIPLVIPHRKRSLMFTRLRLNGHFRYGIHNITDHLEFGHLHKLGNDRYPHTCFMVLEREGGGEKWIDSGGEGTTTGRHHTMWAACGVDFIPHYSVSGQKPLSVACRRRREKTRLESCLWESLLAAKNVLDKQSACRNLYHFLTLP